MSIFSKIGDFIKGAAKVVAPVLGYSLGGPIGGAIGGILGGASSRGAPPAVSSGTLMRYPASGGGSLVTLPGAGTIRAGLGGLAKGAAGAAAGLAAGYYMAADGTVKKRRRRRRGISASELKNHARVENFLSKNFKCKSGGSRPSYVKRKR